MPVRAARPLRLGYRPAEPSRPDLEEPLRLIGLLAESGISLVNISLGTPMRARIFSGRSKTRLPTVTKRPSIRSPASPGTSRARPQCSRRFPL